MLPPKIVMTLKKFLHLKIMALRKWNYLTKIAIPIPFKQLLRELNKNFNDLQQLLNYIFFSFFFFFLTQYQ